MLPFFNQVSATIQEQLQEEHNNPARMMENIKELAHHLYLNVSIENPCDNSIEAVKIF